MNLIISLFVKICMKCEKKSVLVKVNNDIFNIIIYIIYNIILYSIFPILSNNCKRKWLFLQANIYSRIFIN